MKTTRDHLSSTLGSLSTLAVLLLVLQALWPAFAAPGDAQPLPNPGAVPAGLSAADWADIVQQLPATAQQAYLKASNTGASDSFGTSVAVSGDTVVVGAPGEDSAATGVNGNMDDNSAPDAGAAYVFVRSGPPWTQTRRLGRPTSAPDAPGESITREDPVSSASLFILESTRAHPRNITMTDCTQLRQ